MVESTIEKWIWFYYDICGFSIIPLKEKDKRPNLLSWDKYKETRPTREEIQEWIDKGLFKNIAIICGHVSNDLVVIDFDDARIPEEIGLDFNKTIEKGMWVIKTGKGYHVYIKNNNDPGGIEKSLQLKIEYRANCGYVAAPPSVHPNGETYHFLNNEDISQIKPLVESDARFMWEQLKKNIKDKRGIVDKKKTGISSETNYPECIKKALEDKVIEKGNRYYTLYGLSSFFKQIGVPRDLAMSRIKTWNMVKCIPPHSNNIIDQGVNGAYESEKKTGCGFWDKQADMCPFDSKEECSYVNSLRNKDKGKDKQIIEETTMRIAEGTLYEQVYNPITFEAQFVYLNEGNPHYISEIEENNVKFIPVNDRKAIEMGAIYFPDKPVDYGTLKDLIKEIDDFIHKYMDVSDLFRIFSTWYVIFSWVTDNVDTVPYLRVLADFGTGKSRFLHTVGKLCYKPMVVAGATTTACIFRSIERWRGTLILEEYNPKESDEKEDETKILNCGFERNNPVSRCDKDTGRLNYFDTFGPKVISCRQEFKDQALNSRCLTEILRETNRKDIPIILPQEFHFKQQELRNKLLMYRLHNWNNIDPKRIQDIVFPENISKRLRQAFSSFVVLFLDDKDALDMFMDYVVKYNQKIIEEQAQSFDGMIVNAFFELKAEYMPQVTAQMLSEKMASKGIKDKEGNPFSTRSIGRHLKTLGLETKSKSIDGKTYRFVVEDVDVIDSLKRKYVFEDKIEDDGQKKLL